MAEKKFSIPTEMIDLPSKGKLYAKENPLSSGAVEMAYMTAKTEDILTNVNLLRQGIAIERMLKSLIKSEINYEDLTLGDRNALLIAARILGYGKDYSFKYKSDSSNEEEETIKIDLQDLKYKEIDFSKISEKNEFSFELPYSKNTVTYKILTVADDKKIDDEIKGMKKIANAEIGILTTRLKHQITSVNGDYSTKTVREFIDEGYLLARDAIALRQDIAKNTTDIDTTITFTTKNGEEVKTDLPMGVGFFFPQIED
jgi:hypothetical protein